MVKLFFFSSIVNRSGISCELLGLKKFYLRICQFDRTLTKVAGETLANTLIIVNTCGIVKGTAASDIDNMMKA